MFLLLIPYYLRRMFRRGGYLPMMRERFGWVECPRKRSGDRKRVWIQAVSVGELLAIGPLIQRLHSSQEWDVYVSTTTSTGYAMAKDTYRKDAAHVFAFPLDFWPFVRRAWLRVAPDLVILTEGEMWPEHLYQAKKRGIPSVLINARISDRTSARLKAMPFAVSMMHGSVSAIGAASIMDADRILALGIPRNRVRVTGNLKFDAVDGAKVSDEEIEVMCADAGWDMQDDHRVVIGASTWPGEEKLIIDAMCALRAEGLKLRLILVPRHGERRMEIGALLRSYDGLVWAFRSEGVRSAVPADVYVVDTVGELRRFLQMADVAVIGKSFPPHGQGQTPVESAALGIPIIYGPSMSNFRAVCLELEAAGGARKLKDGASLLPALRELLNDPESASRMSENARMVFERNRGSLDRTITLLDEMTQSLPHRNW